MVSRIYPLDKVRLVGGIPIPLKNDGVRQLGRIIPHILWENKNCSKPPTSKANCLCVTNENEENED